MPQTKPSATYFHNGAAASNAQQLVDFYTERFQMNFTPEQKEDLIAFLNSLYCAGKERSYLPSRLVQFPN